MKLSLIGAVVLALTVPASAQKRRAGEMSLPHSSVTAPSRPVAARSQRMLLATQVPAPASGPTETLPPAASGPRVTVPDVGSTQRYM